jgi:hypothetical protein
MDLAKRRSPTALIAIAALHGGLLLLVLAKPTLPHTGTVSYMDLLPVLQPKPKAAPLPVAVNRPVTRPATAVRRPPAKPGEGAITAAELDAAPAEPVLESTAPDFAGGPTPIDIDQLRKQAAKNDTDFKTPLDKVREQERRHKSIETVVAAGAKAGARKDCQNAYSGLGLLAIIPLIYGTVTDNGCKWK